MKATLNKLEKYEMVSNPENYKFGIFYYNAHDPRVIVPKKHWWMGWTFNFGNPYTYALLTGFLLLSVAMGATKAPGRNDDVLITDVE
ncbi:MAG: hypothetical protein HC906_16385 [Bacteroidales bacterium]|nr:hypothetical protein [Bacteroidales bacterium]